MLRPGLDIDATKYELINFAGERLRRIPVKEWLPPDFVDTRFVTVEGRIVKCYYSPAYNKVLRSETHKPVEMESLSFWLRAE
ncbi:hypothetical protein [Erwinia phage Snitter]|nr:hypothetical protein [Erwinia phage Snitter]